MPSNFAAQESGSRRVFEERPGRRRTTVFLFFAVLFPAIVSFGILYRQALTVPYQDDYNAILAFAIDYDHLLTLKTKVLDIAAAQHNEYKLGFEHSVVAFELELTHHLNFAFLTALGHFFLLLIGYVLWLTYRREDADLNRRLLEFLPISLLFFSLTYWENLNWAMTGLQNTPVVFFSLLAIYFLVPHEKFRMARGRFFLACMAAAVAALTSANGFLLGPIGLLILLPRRAYAKSVVWCASFVVPLAAYLYHYTPSVHKMGKHYLVTRPLFFPAFVGCAIPSKWVAAPLGMVMLAIIAVAFRARFDRTNPVACYFAVWIMATGLLTAWVRGATGFWIASRYSMYSSLLLIFCYSFLAQYLPSHWSGFNRRRFYATSIVIAVGFFLIGDVSAYRQLRARRRMVLTGIEFYRANPEVNSPMVDPAVEKNFPKEKPFELIVMNEAIQDGVYTLPPKQEIR